MLCIHAYLYRKHIKKQIEILKILDMNMFVKHYTVSCCFQF